MSGKTSFSGLPEELLHHQLAVVQILLTNPGSAGVVLGQISSDKFQGTSFIKLLRAAEDLHISGHELNEDLVLSACDLEPGEISEIQTNYHLAGGHIANLEKHIHFINEQWAVKRLAKVLGNAVAKLVNKELDSSGAMSFAQTEFARILEQTSSEDISFASHLADQEAFLLNKLNTGDLPDDLFDMYTLNHLRGPKPPTSEVIAISAPPKGGKSALLNNIVKHHVENDIPLYYASGEMQPLMLANRAAAGITDMSNSLMASSLIMSNPYLKKIWENYRKKYGNVRNVLIDRNMRLSTENMRKVVHTWYHKIECKRFIFDRLGLFSAPPGSRDDFQARAKIIAEIRAIANELPELTIVLPIQPTKEGIKSGRISASDLFGGMAPAANITQLFCIWRPVHHAKQHGKTPNTMKEGVFKDRMAVTSTYNQGSGNEFAEIYTPMSNNQPTGSAYVGFDSSKTLFVDIEEDEKIGIRDNVYLSGHSMMKASDEIDRIKKGENSFHNYNGYDAIDNDFDNFSMENEDEDL